MQPSSPSPLIERLRAWSAALEIAPSHVVALLVLASCASAGLVVLWWTARPHPTPSTVPTAATPAITTPSATPSPGAIVVHVSGAVTSAGVYELTAGARVVDAIEAAGGAVDDARTDQLNLARTIQDGEQIHVPDAAEVASAGPVDRSGHATPGVAAGGRISLNTASASELETLPGVGPVLASRIVEHRERAGGFAAIEDLLQVDGIGEKTFAELRELVTR